MTAPPPVEMAAPRMEAGGAPALAAMVPAMAPKTNPSHYDLGNAAAIAGMDAAKWTPMGVGDIAATFGVEVNTVDQWILKATRDEPKDPLRRFPPATGRLSGRWPWWAWSVIEEWGINSGRLAGPEPSPPVL